MLTDNLSWVIGEEEAQIGDECGQEALRLAGGARHLKITGHCHSK